MNTPEAASSALTAKNFLHPDFTEQDLQRKYQSLHERELHAYDDDTFLARRVNSESRLLRNTPELNDQIYNTLFADDDESILDTVNAISGARQQYAPPNEKTSATMLSYLTLIHNIDKHRDDDNLHPTLQARKNAIAALTAKRLIAQIPESSLQDAYLSCNYFEVRMQKLARSRMVTTPHTSKLEQLKSLLHLRQQTENYFSELPIDNQVAPSEEQVAEDSHVIAELFKEVTSTQRYGVKMGYTSDHMGGSYIFNSPPDPLAIAADAVKANAHPLARDSNSVALIVHSNKNHHKKLKPTYLHNQNESAVVNYDPLSPKVVMLLGKDGELYSDAQCQIPYLPTAIAKNRYTAYRDLQATMIAHFYDLTHANESTRHAMPSIIPRVTGSLSRDPLDSIERLVVPRVMSDKATIDTDTPETDNQKTVRTVRQHDVVWHIRRLPEGWKTSPAAYELATRLGITLQEGQTIVKEHTRGSKSLGKVVGHRLVKIQ